MSEQTPWKNGFYSNSAVTSLIMEVDGKSAKWCSVVSLDFPDMPTTMEGTWTYGDFGEARAEVKEAAGGKIERNNLEISMAGGLFKSHGIISEDGTKVHVWGMANCVETQEWLDEDKLKKLKEEREDVKSYSVPYKMQPDNVGRLVWLSGPPGAGKSTTGQCLAKDAGFVYYEADCTMGFLNPFVPTDVENPTLAAFRQKPLTGFSREIVDAFLKAKPLMDAMAANNMDAINLDDLIPLWKVMAEDVKFQHERIGGDFTIAHAVANRKGRDGVREVIPDVVFVVLNMTRGALRKRLHARHGDAFNEDMEKMFIGMTDRYEQKGQDEKNTYQLDITEDMTPKDVMDKVLDLINSK